MRDQSSTRALLARRLSFSSARFEGSLIPRSQRLYPPSVGLSERQIKGVVRVKEKGSITNREYRELTGLSDEGARRDLNDLVSRGVLRAEGKGRSLRYGLTKVGD